MAMTKERIEARLAELRDQRDNLVAQAHACSGAVQELEAWLQVVTKEGGDANANDKSPATGGAA